MKPTHLGVVHTPTAMPPALACAFAVALAAPASVARAGNDDSVLVGNGAALTGGAITATVDDGASLYYNPAGLALVDTNTMDVTASAFGLRYYEVPGYIRTVDGARSEDTAIELLSIPSALGYVRPVSDDVRLGIGIFVPRATSIALRASVSSDFGGSRAEVQLTSSEQSARYVLGAGVGVRAAENLRFGVALLVGYNTWDISQQVFVRWTPAGTDGVFASANTSSFKVGDAGLSVGVQWDPVRELSLGLSAVSPSLTFAGYGRVTAGTASGATSMDGTMLELTTVDDDSLEAAFELIEPARVRMGAALRMPFGTLAIDGDVIFPLDSEALSIHRQLSWNARVGGLFHVSDGLELGVGLFTDLSAYEPSPGQRAHIDYFGGSLGVRAENRVALAEGGDILFRTIVSVRYAIGLGQSNGALLDPTNPSLIVATTPDLVAHEIFLHLGSSIAF